jgi:GntR family transcriptional regulator/MocR family aminotransferase
MRQGRTSAATELLLELRRDDPVALHRQLEHQLRAAIRTGRLPADASLPSTRGLATELGLSRGVVVEAYEQLVAEGYLTSLPGGATRVSRTAAQPAPSPSSGTNTGLLRIDFSYGRPDVTEFPRQAWLRSLRRVLNDVPSERLSYLDSRGAPELRQALATYLNRVRGTSAEPDRIVICNGFAQALGLVLQVLRGRGARRIAIEDPGQTDANPAAQIHGLELLPIPVDRDGLDVEALRRTDADAVIVTPAHQFPTGAVLSAERRTALVTWARERGALIFEDDYDAEFRYDREPIGAIQGLAPDDVLYAGSASKTLAPGLRLGWLAVPGRIVNALALVKEQTDRGSASLEQLAFADFLDRGEFDRHLRHMRPLYRGRRDTLLAAIARDLPGFEPAGASAGLHVVTSVPATVGEDELIAAAAARGVGLYGLGPYRHAPPPPGTGGGLLFGYGRLTPNEIDEGIRLVGEALDEIRSGNLGRPSSAP